MVNILDERFDSTKRFSFADLVALIDASLYLIPGKCFLEDRYERAIADRNTL